MVAFDMTLSQNLSIVVLAAAAVLLVAMLRQRPLARHVRA